MRRASDRSTVLFLLGLSVLGCGGMSEEQNGFHEHGFLDPQRDGPRFEGPVFVDPSLETPEDPVWRESWVPIENPIREHAPSVRLIDDLVAARPGMAIADVGAGGGYFAFRYSAIVGEGGSVRAIDIDRRMTRKVAYEVGRRGVTNITPVQVPVGQLGLAPASVDLVMFLDVNAFNTCGELRNRDYFRQAAQALRPGGRMLIFNNVDPGQPGERCRPIEPDELIALASPGFLLTARQSVEKAPWRAYALLFESRP